MNLLRLVPAIAWTLSASIAAAGQFDWAIQKLPKNLDLVDRTTYSLGSIDRQDYLAMRVDMVDEAREGFKPVMIFARIGKDKTYAPFHVMALRNPAETSVQVRNESIYIRSETAHHGRYSSTYQFRLKNGAFRLVGMERQSITSSQSAGGGAATGGNIELWEGQSVNFLTAEAIYWAQAFDMDRAQDVKRWEMALKQHASGLSPTSSAKRKVRVSGVANVDLEHFDLDDFNSDFLCHYFDYRLKFRSSCK